MNTHRRLLGEEHPDTLTAMAQLALVHRDEGKGRQAETSLAYLSEARRRVLGEQHPQTLTALVRLGQVRLLQGNHAGATSALRDALRRYEATGSNGWERSDCQSMLGASLAGERKWEEAESQLLSGYDRMIRHGATIPANERDSLRAALQAIVRLYQDWCKPEKAADWRRKLQGAKPAVIPKGP